MWFPEGKNQEKGWRLDIISLLAVIGESSVDSHIQVLTSSWFCILPRLIPAPQALLKPTRPTRLPQINAAVVGVHNGVLVPTLNYFPEILHPIEDLPAFAFRVLRITHKQEKKRKAKSEHGEPFSREKTSQILAAADSTDPRAMESAIDSPSEKFTFQKLKRSGTSNRPRILTRKTSPMNILTIISFLWTCGLIIWAAKIGDGTAIVAVGTISMVSSVVGLASWWQPVLMNRPSRAKVPAGDVVIRTREGAFLLVKCNEDVARELYTGTEECKYYVTTKGYRILVGTGTVLLMISVILLVNCGFIMQAAIGLTYMFLNGIFWAASLLNKTRFWNLSNYKIEDVTPKDCQNAHLRPSLLTDDSEEIPSFTRTMWYAIRETQKIGWVKRGGAAPKTSEWDEWLQLAEMNAVQGNRSWPAVRMRDNLVGKGATHISAPTLEEEAQEKVPVFEVPPQETC